MKSSTLGVNPSEITVFYLEHLFIFLLPKKSTMSASDMYMCILNLKNDRGLATTHKSNLLEHLTTDRREAYTEELVAHLPIYDKTQS